MRILVDYMPNEPYQCIYCRDESTMDFTSYICKWNDSGHNCWDTRECPYFIAADHEQEEKTPHPRPDRGKSKTLTMQAPSQPNS